MNNADMPANPIFNSDGFTSGEGDTGLTKREHFAGLIMAQACQNRETTSSSGEGTAKQAVKWADALLKELEK